MFIGFFEFVLNGSVLLLLCLCFELSLMLSSLVVFRLKLSGLLVKLDCRCRMKFCD